MEYTHPEFLMNAEQLEQRLDAGDATLRIYDCSVTFTRSLRGLSTNSGKSHWHKASIPGSGFLDLISEFADTASPFGFTLPSADSLEAAWRSIGISNTSQVVLYSSGHVMWATRAWWMLHSAGHKRVSVLDGGLEAWQAAGGELVPGDCPYPPGDFDVNLDASMWADQSEVLEAIGKAEICTLNALPNALHTGQAASPYGRAGRIAGSINVEYETLLQGGRFCSADELQARLKADGVLDAPRTIAYCGSGISATIDAFALKLLGCEDVRVYDGSLSEWASDDGLPMEVG